MSEHVQQRVARRSEFFLQLRRATPADASALAAMLESLSRQTRYLRFGTERPLHGAAAQREAARAVQSPSVLGIAPSTGALIALAEVAGVASGGAELAVVVRDNYQAQGVGTALVERALEGARRSGITTLRCYVLPENRSALRLVQRLDVPRRSRFHQGLMEVTLHLAE
ncbi:MAG: GNAT family N-acetyltransferase [Chloroflexales bacterium]|nr:GNAT family N-acetyltransferase [Chloroflexales bacterium]